MRLASPTLARAAADYRWLLDRGYAAQAALKLVGDRMQMTRDERMILFRGVASIADSASRASILKTEAAGRPVLVDGHNQALTAMHYLAGRPLFLGSDGLLRDAGGSHGRIAHRELFERAVAALVSALARNAPASVAIYLDAPIPGSGEHARLFRELFATEGIKAEVALEGSADFPLKAAPPGSLVATSDSAIVDALAARPPEGRAWVYDAARWAIELSFGASDFLDLGRLLGASH